MEFLQFDKDILRKMADIIFNDTILNNIRSKSTILRLLAKMEAYTLPPPKTKRSIITNLETKTNQNCWKI